MLFLSGPRKSFENMTTATMFASECLRRLETCERRPELLFASSLI